jgi:hypothetical protein
MFRFSGALFFLYLKVNAVALGERGVARNSQFEITTDYTDGHGRKKEGKKKGEGWKVDFPPPLTLHTFKFSA